MEPRTIPTSEEPLSPICPVDPLFDTSIFLSELIYSETPLMLLSKNQVFPCSQCSEVFPSQTCLETHSLSHYAKFVCPFCQRPFTQKGNLNVHIRTHTNERPFGCKICCKRFKTSTHLKDHLTCHSSERPFKCHVCEGGYKRKHTLKIHLMTHTDEMPFDCDFCGKLFTEKCNLKVHLRVHYDERPYLCQKASCVKAFRTRAQLNQHLRGKKHAAEEDI